jgi:hypothetical protein
MGIMSGLWSKARREGKRLLRDILLGPKRVAGLMLSTRYYDTFLAGGRAVTTGHLPGGPKVAIYLIYPDRGLLPSHVRSLTYLASAGYAPLVVSNLPLSATDRARALGLCWRLIERPNFGHDFGGYRDAVRFLWQEPTRPHRLAILNDSCWFPVPDSNDWLSVAEAAGTDIVGAVGNRAFPRPAAHDTARPDWTFAPTGRQFYYGSFALLVSGAALNDPDFPRFWKHLRLGREKRHVVRHGEIAFSQWAMRRGHSHSATLPVQTLPDDLARLDDDTLRAVLSNLIVIGDDGLRAAGNSLATTVAARDTWRDQAISHIMKVVARQGPAYALAWFSVLHKGHPFLKKSPVWQDPVGARVTAAIADRIGGQAGAEIRAEMAILRPQRTGSADT